MTSSRRILPGFGLSLGYSLFYLTLLVLVPLGALIVKTTRLTWAEFWNTVTDPVVVASYRLSFQASLAAAVINGVFGLVVAWVLVRYPFPGRRLLDAAVDFPFALPTAVAGLTFGSLFTRVPWIDQVKVGSCAVGGANAVLSAVGAGRIAAEALSGLDEMRVILMLVFVGLPFVVRTVQPSWPTSIRRWSRRPAAWAPGGGRSSGGWCWRKSSPRG